MDFGMATNYTLIVKDEKNKDDKKKDERKKKERVPSGYGFIGTDKYAARSVHEGFVTHCKDDMESWLYM